VHSTSAPLQQRRVRTSVGPSTSACRRVQNAAARLIFSLRRIEHINDALMCLHWLRVAEHVRFKMAVLVYKSLHGSAPSYFTNIFTPLSIAGVVPFVRRHHTNCSFLVAGCPLLATARFRSRAPLSGTACHPTLPHLVALTLSVPA
jgi:hypothetical protein